MGYRKKASGENTKFRLDVISLYYGWLSMQITVDGKSFWYRFDEAYDNVIDLMNLYNTVSGDETKRGVLLWKENLLSFYWNDSGNISFKVYRLNCDWFRLHFDVEFFDPEESFEKTVTVTKKELLGTLDAFFEQILASKGFPLQYPFGCEGHDEELSEKADALLHEIFDVLPKKAKNDDELYLTLNAICSNAIEMLNPETQKKADEYRNMLKTHVLPEGYH